MKKIALFQLTICLISIIVLGISALTLADIASETDKEAERHFEKANELLKRMDYQAAIAEYSKVIELSSDSTIAQDAQYWIGQSQFRAGQFDAAQATFAKLIETYPASAIVPATQLMVERIQQAKKTEALRSAIGDTAAEGYIIDPSTGVKYTKAATVTGKNDVIGYTMGLNLSPNGKFLLHEGTVVPLGGSEPVDLVEGYVKGVWSPDGTKVAFYSGDAISVVPVSPQTGRPTGPVRKLLEGPYSRIPLVTWSPDSQRLAFVRDWDIWILSVTDGSLTQIRDGAMAWGWPKWSPDGKTILYRTWEEAGARLNLCTISVDGQSSRKVVTPLGSATLRTSVVGWWWSPDSKWIVYRRLGGRIHILNLTDNQKLEIKPPSDVGDFFAWSPDGKRMLFYRPSYDDRYEVRVVSASGGAPVSLRGPTKSWPQHRWSPDSKTVLVAGYKDGHTGIWLSPLSGGDPVQLEVDVSVAGEFLVCEVSPAGDKLAFVVDRADGKKDLYVVPISLKDARTTGPAVRIFEGWNPGYASDLAYDKASWSPDGTKLIVVHGQEIWITFSNGDEPVRLAEGVEYPGWSPDGMMVDYMAWPKQDPEGGLYVIPSRGGNPTKIPGGSNNRVWSPDSKKVAVVSKDSISTVTVADGQSREIAKLKDVGLDRVFYLSWSPDGKYIACDGKEKDKPSPIILIPFEGGKLTMLAADDDSWKTCLRWSPDGKWISYRSASEAKVRPEGTMWEADFEEIVKKASH